jgi:glutathione peroxidase-family protein
MRSKVLQATLISLLCLAVSAFSGCAWENGTNHQNDGSDGQDAFDAGIDEGPFYPPGPYGNEFGDTVANFMVYKCLCPGGPAQGKEFKLEEFLGSKAILVTAHSGNCPYCSQQASTMESGLWEPYKTRGFKILLVLISDEHGNSDLQSVLDYCCAYQQQYGLTFTVAADPNADVMYDYLRGTPLNMLLDDEMVIRYKVEGNLPDTLAGNVEALLDE